jgi:hypothetical protein
MKKNIARPRRVIRIKHFSYRSCLSNCDEVQLLLREKLRKHPGFGLPARKMLQE